MGGKKLLKNENINVACQSSGKFQKPSGPDLGVRWFISLAIERQLTFDLAVGYSEKILEEPAEISSGEFRSFFLNTCNAFGTYYNNRSGILIAVHSIFRTSKGVVGTPQRTR